MTELRDSSGSFPVDHGADTAADPPVVEDLLDTLDDIADSGWSRAVRAEVAETRELLAVATERGLIESKHRDLTASDAAEAFVGSVIFASPLLVEGGVFEIASYLFETTPFGLPVFLVANTLFVVLLTHALLEWTGRDREETALILGRIPVRLLMVLGISFTISAVLMTVWGRVGDWRQPVEALARINVVWTVASLGAALGDILSEDEPPAHVLVGEREARRTREQPHEDVQPSTPSDEANSVAPETLTDGALIVELQSQFDELEAALGPQANTVPVDRLRMRAADAMLEHGFGDRVQKYTGRDVAEAFVGSIFFSVPFLVEGGVFEVAAYFLSFRLGLFPVFFLVNAAFVFLMIAGLVYWAGPQDVQVSRPIFGVLPRRLVGIALVSFLTAAALMTMWGRVDGWADPEMALARISVVWTAASFGAALGDILPGESSGEDISDELDALGDRIEEELEWGGGEGD